MFTIDFSDHTEQVEPTWRHQIEQLLTFAKEQEAITEDAELSVTFVDKDEIQSINRDYRDKDKITDVISFAFEEDEDIFEDFEGVEVPRVLGDIIICTDVAKAQAEQYNHSFERELGFLALHGFLHLLGYDHMTEEDERVMFGRQDEILSAFGLTRDR
ncbi:rRNA maturation RNase YbeY [Staphylococcus sp. 17KM0847]|uniref:rRNA maturation RNase YbeY n=1 Tax=Staphylococcus sp. 17KM0847 TaxID=2583989 RepID=UPI0015DC1B8B|nr:rRNA maturation RNase YbeY [Staphylococcus sp. 17KM0847]QLK86049.1 rRNA maturation RNase YbeY [Staphylococcus sp. 17KM0847]